MVANCTRVKVTTTFKFIRYMLHVPVVCIFVFIFCGVFSWQFFFNFFYNEYIYQTYFFSKTIFPHMMYLDNPYMHIHISTVILNVNYLSIYMYLHYYDLIVVLFKRMCTVPSMNLVFCVLIKSLSVSVCDTKRSPNGDQTLACMMNFKPDCFASQ